MGSQKCTKLFNRVVHNKRPDDDPLESKHVATFDNKLVCLTEIFLFSFVPIRHIGMTSMKFCIS